MNLSQQFVLPADVTIVRAHTLPDVIQTSISYHEDDYVITRPRTRTTSSIISPQLASFLERFRQPQTIVRAVVAHAQAHQLDPERTLVELIPALERVMSARWVVPADAPDAAVLAPRYIAGNRLGAYTIVRCLQSLHDTDVYQALTETGTYVAIKILRPEADADSRRVFANELRVLQRLNHPCCVHLLDYGQSHEESYLVLSWSEGRQIHQVVDEMRRSGVPRARLLKLVVDVLDVYSSLHAQDCLHGDVHLNNVLIDQHGTIMLVDFGYLQLLEDSPEERLMRGGSPLFYDPEHAATKQMHQPAPALTAQSEQYSLAVLCYWVLAGQHYLEFSVNGDEMLRQILEDAPIPFHQHGARPWPEVETILHRALDKQPQQRFACVADLATALRTVLDAHLLDRQALPWMGDADALLDQFLNNVNVDGPWLRTGFPTTPLCATSQGATGVAYALYRLACIKQDARLLSLASMWSGWAITHSTEPTAFVSAERGTTADVIGPVSLYLTASGMYATHALISHARDDLESLQQAVTSFVSAVQVRGVNLDLFLGQSGVLLGCASLYAALHDHPVVDATPIATLARRELEMIWTTVATYPPILECAPFWDLPMAHGWAGLLYATLRWCALSGDTLPATCEERLQQLAACGQEQGQGMSWLVTLDPARPEYQPGRYQANWCNGSAGLVFLWTLAHAVFQRLHYHELAVRAAQHVWDNPTDNATLCCGATGQAYSLLNLYRYSGDALWLRRATERMQHAKRSMTAFAQSPTSLYQGEVGTLLALIEFQHPEQARLPFFEEEGWIGDPAAPAFREGAS